MAEDEISQGTSMERGLGNPGMTSGRRLTPKKGDPWKALRKLEKDASADQQRLLGLGTRWSCGGL